MTYQVPDAQQINEALNTVSRGLLGLRLEAASLREFLAGLGYRTPAEWQQRLQVVVRDPDGWRGLRGLSPKPLDEPITEDEFMQRAAASTMDYGAATRPGYREEWAP